MIDKQAAIDAILSETIFETVDDLRRNISFCERESGWTGGILTAIDAIDGMDEMEDCRLTPKPVDVCRSVYGFDYYKCPTCKIKNFRLRGKALFCDQCGQAVKWDDRQG